LNEEFIDSRFRVRQTPFTCDMKVPAKIGSGRTRWTTDPVIWKSVLKIPGNQSRWRTFRASLRQAQSSKAHLLCLPVEFFSARSRDQLRELVLRISRVARQSNISVSIGVGLLGKNWPLPGSVLPATFCATELCPKQAISVSAHCAG
jgi:hypothetical protein